MKGKLLVLVAVLALATGCQTTETLMVSSTPVGARVFIKELPHIQGTTPCNLEIPIDGRFTVVCNHPRHGTQEQRIYWRHVPFFLRLGGAIIVTPVGMALGAAIVVVSAYGSSGEGIILGFVIFVGSPFYGLNVLLDTGYYVPERAPPGGPTWDLFPTTYESKVHFAFTPEKPR